jgi:hypothetical protein
MARREPRLGRARVDGYLKVCRTRYEVLDDAAPFRATVIRQPP